MGLLARQRSPWLTVLGLEGLTCLVKWRHGLCSFGCTCALMFFSICGVPVLRFLFIWSIVFHLGNVLDILVHSWPLKLHLIDSVSLFQLSGLIWWTLWVLYALSTLLLSVFLPNTFVFPIYSGQKDKKWHYDKKGNKSSNCQKVMELQLLNLEFPKQNLTVSGIMT